jgi:hypothetical protein
MTPPTFSSLNFTSLLGLAFIILKLCGVIRWSWGWVLLPLYGPLAIVIGVIAAVFVTGVIYAASGRTARGTR